MRHRTTNLPGGEPPVDFEIPDDIARKLDALIETEIEPLEADNEFKSPFCVREDRLCPVAGR